jgi:hypothetical protein
MVAMKLFTSLFFLLSLPILYLIVRDRFRSLSGLLLVAILAFNPFMFRFKEEIRADFPFLFFTLVSLYCIKRFIIGRDFSATRVADMILLGTVIFLSFFIRGNGILMLPCLFLAQIVENRNWWVTSAKKYRMASVGLVPYATFLFLMMAVKFIMPGDAGSYGEALRYISLQSIGDNIVYYAFLLVRFFAIPIRPLGIFLYLILVPCFVIGLVKRFKRDYLYASFILITIGFFIIYPGTEGLRYIFPVIPFFLYFAFSGMDFIQPMLPGVTGMNRMRTLVVAAILFLSVYGIGSDLYSQYSESSIVEGPYRMESMEMFRYLRTHTPQDSVIIFFKPRVMTLYTGRLSARTLDFDRAIRCGADYAVIKRLCPLNLIMKGHERDVKEIFSNGEFTIYRLIPRRLARQSMR